MGAWVKTICLFILLSYWSQDGIKDWGDAVIFGVVLGSAITVTISIFI